MSTTENGLNPVEDADMADCDGEKVLTMVDVLKEQEDFEEDANAVLGASDDKNCTYNMGYVKRQAIYACVTCTEAKEDPLKRAGVCLACSLTCHENHDLIELYTKRNFRCDCGNSKFNSHPCQFTPSKTDLNENNSYNQNFSGLYCTCQRPYPDPESNLEDEMIQCIICEDWLHASHLEATIPGNDQYAEMICKGCMEKNPFLHDYSDLAVNVENTDIDILNIESSNTEKLTNGDTKKNENEVNGDPSCSTKQILLAENDIDMAVTSSEANTSDTENIDRVTNTLEKQPSIETNSDNKNEIQDEGQKENEENESKVSDTEQLKNKESDNTQLESNTEEEKQTLEITETNTEAITSQEPQKLLCDQVSEPTDKESLNETKNDSGIETSEITPTSTDDAKDSELDAEKMEEDRLLADPSLEDNIQDLAELINENNKSDNKAKSTEVINSDKTSSEILNPESSEMELPNSTENESEIISDENTNASPTREVKESTEKSAELDANAMEEIDATDLKPNPDETSNNDIDNEVSVSKNTDNENKKSVDDQVVEDKTASTEDKNNSDTGRAIKSGDVEMSSDKIEDPQNHSNNGSEMDTTNSEPTENVECSNKIFDINVSENKRKLSTEDIAEDNDTVKRTKPNEVKLCVRPKSVKRIHKGATFWPPHFRQKLCTCNECLSMYKDLSVLFLTDLEDTVSFYENLGKEKVRIEGKPKSQYEKGLEALSSLDRVQQINALTEYNRMRDKLLDFLKSFKDKKEIVKEEDIKAFFANMKPKREPDGVYFCR